MNVFKTEIDDELIYDVLYNRKYQLVINRLSNNSKKILEYFNDIKERHIDIDSFIDYTFCKYIINIEDENEQLNTLKQSIQEKIIGKYQTKSIVEFIEKKYLKIKELTYDTREQLLVANQMMVEIASKNIKSICIENLFKKYNLEFFDNINLFYKENKIMIFRTLTKEEIMNILVEYRINNLFKFIRIHRKEIKESSFYNNIIIKIDLGIKNIIDIYKKEQYYLQFIYLLEDLKDAKIIDIKKEYEKISKQKESFIIENGIRYESKIDLTEQYKQLEEAMKNKDVDSKMRFIQCFVKKRENEYEILLNDIDRIKPPLTDIITGNNHSYYKPFKKICFEKIFLVTSMRIFINIYLKSYGYEELENTLTELFRDIYQYVLFEEENIVLYKQEAENIIKTIKNFMSIKSNYTSYVDVFYISSVLERLLRQIFVVTCLDKNSYIDDCTLKDIFDEKYNSNLRVVVGETLYKWLKFYLYHDIEEKNGFIIKEGLDIRNTISHGKYKVTENLSEMYYILIYLLINLLWSVDLKMIVLPTEETENILVKAFNNLME